MGVAHVKLLFVPVGDPSELTIPHHTFLFLHGRGSGCCIYKQTAALGYGCLFELHMHEPSTLSYPENSTGPLL